MKPEIKKLWVDALRSGEYKQGKRALCIIEEDGTRSYCCLGVLTDLYQKHNTQPLGEEQMTNYVLTKQVISYEGSSGHLPKDVVEWADLSSDIPAIKTKNLETTLLAVNDILNFTFLEIADLIEEQL